MSAGIARFSWARVWISSACAAALLTAAGPSAAAVGSAACAGCHGEIYRRYMASAMARTSGPLDADPLAAGAFRHGRSGVEYRIERQRGEAFFEFDLPGIHGRRRLDYFIGSGAAGRSYLYALGGFLYEAPVSYYAAESRWGISPGYEDSESLFLTRAVRPACLGCHAGRLQPAAGTENGYGAPPFLENGVGCERCHGVGEKHAVVNPARLDAERRESVCAQCHLTGEVRVVRRGHEHEFQPGERLAEHAAVFVRQGGGAMNVTSHFEKLAQSACRKAAGERLWCGTCHDAHGARVDVRVRCAGCHQDRQCQRGEDCMSCHMPKRPVRDVQHAVYTDHSIPRRPGARREAGADAPLVLFGGGAASDRDLGLAYARTPGFEARARGLLEKAEKRDPEDVAVLVELGFLYDRQGREEQAMRLYERALRLDPTQVTAAVNLASAWVKRGRVQDAIGLWRDALARQPGLEPARLNLAGALYRMGDRRGARETLRQLLELNPGSVLARRLWTQWRE